jgi:hypothetical protein
MLQSAAQLQHQAYPAIFGVEAVLNGQTQKEGAMGDYEYDCLAGDTIRALLDGKSPNGTQPEECGPWTEVVEALHEAHERGGTPAVKRSFDALTREYGALADLIAGDPKPEPPIQEYPALPDSVVLPEVGENEWLKTYKNYAGTISPMTPELFHEGGALFLAAVAVARRLKVPMPFDDVYPNLFMLWVAPTTVFRKTTALNIARNLANRVLCHLLAAQDTTFEALLSDLAGREPSDFNQMSEIERSLWQKERNFAAQRGWVLDEMSGLLSSAGKDYNAGLVEMLLRLYECESSFTRSTRAQGRVTARNTYLSLLGASTPGVMASHLAADRLWAMGWWPRFAILTPEVEYPEWKVARATDEPRSLAETLQRLCERLPGAKWPDPPQALTVSMSESAMEAWGTYNKAVGYDLLKTFTVDERPRGTYGRLPIHVIKVATILAALEWPEEKTAPSIELTHLAQAVAICERWRASAHRALNMASQGKKDKLKCRILEVVSRHEPKGITRAELKKLMKNHNPEEIDTAVDEMLGVDLREVKSKPGREGGRPTRRLRLVRG